MLGFGSCLFIFPGLTIETLGSLVWLIGRPCALPAAGEAPADGKQEEAEGNHEQRPPRTDRRADHKLQFVCWDGRVHCSRKCLGMLLAL